MTKSEFAKVMRESLIDSLGEGYEVSVTEVLKNNSIRRTGLVIKTADNNLAPTLYLEDLLEAYNAGKITIEDAVIKLHEVYINYKAKQPFDSSQLTDFDVCKDKIIFKLINADKNKEYLEDTPHKIVCGDLALIFCMSVYIDCSSGGTVVIHNKLAKYWGVSADELYDLAIVNTPVIEKGRLISFTDFAYEITGIECPTSLPMWICSNIHSHNGAGAILYKDILEKAIDTIGDDFYIIPCTIHECLLIPLDMDVDIKAMRTLIRSVNGSEISEADFLSNNLYVYRRSEDQISIA